MQLWTRLYDTYGPIELILPISQLTKDPNKRIDLTVYTAAVRSSLWQYTQ